MMAKGGTTVVLYPERNEADREALEVLADRSEYYRGRELFGLIARIEVKRMESQDDEAT